MDWRPTIRRDERSLGLLSMFACLICEGLYGPLAKGLSGTLSPLTLLLLTEALMAIFIVLFLGFIPLSKAIAKIPTKNLLIAMGIGVLSSGIAPYLWFAGIRSTSAMNASLITSANILFAVAFAYILLKETIDALQAVGCAVVMIGVLMIQLSGVSSTSSVQFGDFLILLGTMTFALGTVIFKKYLTKEHPEVILFIRCVSGLATVGIIGFVLQADILGELQTFPPPLLPMLLAFAFFARFLDLTFFYAALDRLPSVTVSLILNATPLVSILFSMLLLHEKLTPYHLVAGVLIVFGMMVEHVRRPVQVTLRERLLRLLPWHGEERMSPELIEQIASH